MDELNQLIKIDDIIIDDDFNCRGPLTPLDVNDLADSIKMDGLLQAIVVCKNTPEAIEETGKLYRLIAGFRRTYAHLILKRTVIEAKIKETMTEQKARLMNLNENLKRVDLNMFQEAKAIEALRKTGMVQTEIALQLGKSQAYVQTRLALLKMPEPIQEAVHKGLINQTDLKSISQKNTPKEQLALAKLIKEHKERGTKISLPTRSAPKPTDKKPRKKNEIEDFLVLLVNSIGPCVGTRLLAWAAGNISDNEVTEYIREEYPDFPGFDYSDNPSFSDGADAEVES